MNNKQDKGFTLVELLIVIVILGILATVTVFAVRGITDQGQSSACNADYKTVQTAVEAFYAQNGTSATLTEAALVPNYMVAQSKNFNVTSAGVVELAVTGTPSGYVQKCTAAMIG